MIYDWDLKKKKNKTVLLAIENAAEKRIQKH